MTTTRIGRRDLAALGPLGQLKAGRLGRRLPQLAFGLAIYGVSMALVIRAGLGQIPWDVLHVGLTHHLPLSVGEAVIAVSLVVLLAWIPLRQLPGMGTIANALLIGVATDATLALVATPHAMAGRIAMMLGGVALNGLATALYIGAQFGPGPRDGLMTGISRRTGASIRLVRTGLEVCVVAVGWLLGGTIGAGTVLYALAIGPVTQLLLPWCTVAVEYDGPVGRRAHQTSN